MLEKKRKKFKNESIYDHWGFNVDDLFNTLANNVSEQLLAKLFQIDDIRKIWGFLVRKGKINIETMLNFKKPIEFKPKKQKIIEKKKVIKKKTNRNSKHESKFYADFDNEKYGAVTTEMMSYHKLQMPWDWIIVFPPLR